MLPGLFKGSKSEFEEIDETETSWENIRKRKSI